MNRLVVVLALLQGVSAFMTVARPHGHVAAVASTSSQLASSPASATPSSSEPVYVRCGRCQTSYTINDEEFGDRSRRLECSVCGHSWFQAKDRLMTVRPGFQLVELQDWERQRIQENVQQGRDPKFTGEIKLYVGNISFNVNEQDLQEAFGAVGAVGDVSLVRDETGRPKGFGFVTLVKREDGLKALEELNGLELKGRAIAVRESTN